MAPEDRTWLNKQISGSLTHCEAHQASALLEGISPGGGQVSSESLTGQPSDIAEIKRERNP